MKSVYVIAEAGVNHNGSLKKAFRLVDAAKKVGADAVKFQTYITEDIVCEKLKPAPYQQRNIKSYQSQYKMLKQLELNFNDFIKIKKYSTKKRITFLSTPDDIKSLFFLVKKLKIKVIKIGSGELTNIPFLRIVAKMKKPVILSTGMSNISEITRALKALDNIQKRKITLLHATTSYPCPADETNLRAIQTLIKKFKIPVGFSDHTSGTEAAISAVALGACVVEKHLTLNKNDIGPDHKASLEPAEFKAMVKGIRFVEKALGTGIKKPTASEKIIKKYIEKKVFCACRIMKKTKIYEKHLKFKRGATGLVVSKLNKILGKKILRNKQENEPIYFKDFYKKI